ncbi:MAG: hypothetical protein ACF8GE_02645 [Phycisphaerales bacterium JB043]
MRSVHCGCLCGLLVGITTPSVGGPLTPPGAPESSYKTLVEVEPRIAITQENTPGDANSVFHISAPGSYYLTGNVLGEVGKNGVEINASNVTLDLNGFEIVGVAGALDGIKSLGGRNLHVFNGSIRDWVGEGLDGGNGADGRYYNLYLYNNGNSGMEVGANSIVENCTARDNAWHGIETGGLSRVEGCVLDGNGANGISMGNRGVVKDCLATGNNHGISVGNNTTITECSVFSNSRGIHGIQGVVVESCVAESNTTDGIQIGSGTVVNCVTESNGWSGIEVNNSSIVRSNSCRANDIGISVTGSESRIEGNQSTGNTDGYDVSGSSNLIIGNYATGNTGLNFDISINNRYGEIVDWSLAGTPGVSGNSSISFMGTTDPYANYAR